MTRGRKPHLRQCNRHSIRSLIELPVGCLGRCLHDIQVFLTAQDDSSFVLIPQTTRYCNLLLPIFDIKRIPVRCTHARSEDYDCKRIQHLWQINLHRSKKHIKYNYTVKRFTVSRPSHLSRLGDALKFIHACNNKIWIYHSWQDVSSSLWNWNAGGIFKFRMVGYFHFQ